MSFLHPRHHLTWAREALRSTCCRLEEKPGWAGRTVPATGAPYTEVAAAASQEGCFLEERGQETVDREAGMGVWRPGRGLRFYLHSKGLWEASELEVSPEESSRARAGRGAGHVLSAPALTDQH